MGIPTQVTMAVTIPTQDMIPTHTTTEPGNGATIGSHTLMKNQDAVTTTTVLHRKRNGFDERCDHEITKSVLSSVVEKPSHYNLLYDVQYKYSIRFLLWYLKQFD